MVPARHSIRFGVALTLLACGLSGCVGNQDTTGSIQARAALPAGPAGLEAYAAEWGKRYDADHANKTAAINYATALRGLDRTPQAVAVLETAAIKYPFDKGVLAAYGKTLADAGRLKEAADVLGRSHTPDKPDWSVLSAQGSVADQLGDHAAAQRYYEAALRIEPNSAATLSNLGLSYALDKRLADAETSLRKAAALPGATARVRQNLSFVLALAGKDAEAEAVARQDLSAQDATASVAAVRAMATTGVSRGPVRSRRVAIPADPSG